MGEILRLITEYNLVDYAIGLMGFFSVMVVAERAKALYFDYSIRADEFMKQIRDLVQTDKIEEAIAFCAANQKKPLAHVLKRMLERADRDESSIEKGVDIAISEVAPHMTKRLGYLSMVANVTTMIGLLGTVFGLIMSFKAISFADPTQKQTLLADGIAMAMHATALGLAIAIPTMIIYSFLHAKQGRLFSEIEEHTQKILDLLMSRSYEAFNEKNAFTQPMNGALNEKFKTTAAPSSKVS